MIRALPITMLLLLPGCGEDAEEAALDGSVARVYSLDHDDVRARLSESQLAIQYLALGESVVQVVVELESQPVTGPGTISLTEHGEVLGRRGEATLPAFVGGQLVLAAFEPAEGATVAGHFQATVSSEANEYSVRGTFSTTLSDFRNNVDSDSGGANTAE